MTAILDALARPSGLLFLSATLLGGAIMDTAGFFGPGALGMASAAGLLAVAAGVRERRATPRAARPDAGAFALLWVVAAGWLLYGVVKARGLAALALLGAEGVLLVAEARARASAGGSEVGRRARLSLWCACAAALAVLPLRARDGSFIDVWIFQQDGAAALLRGENPYAITYPNIYGDMRFYGPAVADASRVRAFPYPPQTILADLPAFALLGDVRYTMVLAVLASAWILARLAPLGLGTLAAAALLLLPGTPRVLLSAWTEPILLPFLLLLAVAVRRLSAKPPVGWGAVGLAGALAAGAKQYSPLLLAPFLSALPARGRARAVALAAGFTAAAVLPFVLWDGRGFWDGVVAMQFRQPFRRDSLSWPAAIARLGFAPPSGAWGFALTGAVVALCWPRRGSLAQAMTCAAASFVVFLLTAKQAFLNYYWLADALLLAAAVLQVREEVGEAPPDQLASGRVGH